MRIVFKRVLKIVVSCSRMLEKAFIGEFLAIIEQFIKFLLKRFIVFFHEKG